MLKLFFFDANEMEELVVYQKKNQILNNSIYPHYDIEGLKNL